MSRLGQFGLVFSVLYVAIVAYLQSSQILEIRRLPLNEFGDFFAGAFGPLAVFWVILGFFLQSRELANSVNALTTQAEQLRVSSIEQKNLVETNKRAAELELERYLSELKMEASKQSISASVDLGALPKLLDRADASRMAVLGAFGSLESGAVLEWISEKEEIGRQIDEIGSAYDACSDLINHCESIKYAEEAMATHYGLALQASELRARVEYIIESDIRERELHWQAQIAHK